MGNNVVYVGTYLQEIEKGLLCQVHFPNQQTIAVFRVKEVNEDNVVVGVDGTAQMDLTLHGDYLKTGRYVITGVH